MRKSLTNIRNTPEFRKSVISKWKENGFLRDVKGLSNSSVADILQSQETAVLLNPYNIPEDTTMYWESELAHVGSYDNERSLYCSWKIIQCMYKKIKDKHCEV